MGEESRRREPRRVDYLLRYRSEMIAVLEAKDENQAADAGLEQAKAYARMLDVPFAYSSNGRGFVEFDFFLNKGRELSAFPAPDELWHRWTLYHGGQATPQLMSRAAESEEPLYGSSARQGTEGSRCCTPTAPLPSVARNPTTSRRWPSAVSSNA